MALSFRSVLLHISLLGILWTGIKSQSENADILIVARRTELWWLSLDSPDARGTWIPLENLTAVTAVEYDPVDEMVYWSDTDVMGPGIHRAKLSREGSSDPDFTWVAQEKFVSTTAHGLAMDVRGRRLYWTSQSTIESIALDGSSRQTVLSDDLVDPRAIVLDGTNNVLYWADRGASSARIEQSKTDGSSRSVLVETDLISPSSMALDTVYARLYWADSRTMNTGRIEVINLDGSGREVVTDTLANIHGLALDGDFVFWTDFDERSVQKINYNTKQDPDVVMSYMSRPAIGDIHVKTSTNGDGMMFLGGVQEIRKLDPNKPRDLGEVLPITVLGQVQALEYDSVDEYIYWADNLGQINRAAVDGTEDTVVLHNVSSHGIAVGMWSRLLFWASPSDGKIEVSNRDGSNRRVVIPGSSSMPVAIALDDINNMIYWTQQLPTKIQRATYNGTALEELVTTSLDNPSGLTLDRSKMYWADTVMQTIEMANLDGSNREVLLAEIHVGQSLDHLDGFLFWELVPDQAIIRTHLANVNHTGLIMSNQEANRFTAIKATVSTAQICLEDDLLLPDKSSKACTTMGLEMTCTVTCDYGYYISDSPTKDRRVQFGCSAGVWEPENRARECVSHCQGVQCKNGATCGPKQTYFQCYCKPGYTGTLCEETEPTDAPATTRPPRPSAGQSSSGGDDGETEVGPGVIAGIIIGFILFILIVAGCVICCKNRRIKKKNKKAEKDAEEADSSEGKVNESFTAADGGASRA